MIKTIIAALVLSLQAQLHTPIKLEPSFLLQRETSDPKSKALLDKVKQKFDMLKAHQLTFKVNISQGNEKENQKGKVYFSDEKYRIEMETQDVISDGKTVWFHAKKNNEVQISNANSQDVNMLSPATLLRIYENDKEIILAPSYEANGKTVIEFKPTSRNTAEYSKGKIVIDKAANTLSQLHIFGKDASVYVVEVENISPITNLGNISFSFDFSKHPGINKVDLR